MCVAEHAPLVDDIPVVVSLSMVALLGIQAYQTTVVVLQPWVAISKQLATLGQSQRELEYTSISFIQTHELMTLLSINDSLTLLQGFFQVYLEKTNFLRRYNKNR